MSASLIDFVKIVRAAFEQILDKILISNLDGAVLQAFVTEVQLNVVSK